MKDFIEEDGQQRARSKSGKKQKRLAEAFRRSELIQEQRLLNDQLADFWEPRFVENKPRQDTMLIR